MQLRWRPLLDPRVAAKINKRENPNRPVSKPATNEPRETIVGDPGRPVTAAMQTAQQLIAAANAANTRGGTMGVRTADGATPAGAAADKRVDVTGVGGVMQDSNDAASRPDAQASPTGMGGVGVEDVEAQQHQTITTAPRDSDDSGFDKERSTGDSGPTSTWQDGSGVEHQTDPVTSKPFPDTARGAGYRQAYDDGVGGNLQDGKPGSASRGVQPVDPVGRAGERVDVLDRATSPANNSGDTMTWSGTDGNGVLRQQAPVTKVPTKSDGITSRVAAIIRLTDVETEMGIIGRDDKWTRFAELEQHSDESILAQLDALARVRVAGLRRQASAPVGAKRLPSFRRITAALDEPEPQVVDHEVFDACLFTR